MPERLQYKLDEHRLELAVRVGACDLLLLGLEEEFSPQGLLQHGLAHAQLGADEARKVVEAERPAVHCGRKEHVPLFRRKLQLAHARLVGHSVLLTRGGARLCDEIVCIALTRGGARVQVAGDRIHLLHHIFHVVPGLKRRELELNDKPIDLVEHEHRHHVLVPRLLEHRVSLHADALDGIDDEQRAIRQARRRRHLAAKVDVSR